MALEDLTGAKYIDDLVSANPAAGDNVSQGDDHIRGIKNVLKTTFPSIDGAVTPTDTELNYVDGVTSAIQTQLDSPVAKGIGGDDGFITLNCSANTHGIKLKSPPHSASASYTLTFPNDDGSANEMLLTNGSGVLDWTTVGTASLAADAVTGAKIADNAIDSEHYTDGSIDTAHIADDQITTAKIADDVGLGGNPTTTTQSASNNSTRIATTAYTDAAIAALADSAPSTLNTLNELAAALGDDANYATTTTNAIAAKLPLAGGTMTGNIAHAGAFTIDTVGDISLDSEGAVLIKASGTEIGRISNSSNDMIIKSAVSNADMLFKGNDGGSTVTALKLDMSDGGAATFNNYIDLQGNNIYLADSAKAVFGTGSDLQIYHDGNNSYIDDAGTGALTIRSNTINLQKYTGETLAEFQADGAVTLRYDNVAKFQTTAAGATVTGTLTADLADNSINSEHYVDGSIDHGHLANSAVDSAKIASGAIDLSHMSANSVDSPQYVDGSIDTAHIGDSQITLGKMAANSVNSGQYVDGSIDHVHLSANCIDGDNIGDNVINSEHYVDRSIDAAHISLDTRQGVGDDVYLGNGHDYIFYDASDGMRFYTAGAEEMRLKDNGDLHVDGDVIAFSTVVSDERLKHDIEPITDALSKVNQLNGVTFTYNADDKKSAGLIAQDVEKVLPSAVSEKELPLKHDDGIAYKTLQYDQTIGLLVEAIKELTAKVEELENK